MEISWNGRKYQDWAAWAVRHSGPCSAIWLALVIVMEKTFCLTRTLAGWIMERDWSICKNCMNLWSLTEISLWKRQWNGRDWRILKRATAPNEPTHPISCFGCLLEPVWLLVFLFWQTRLGEFGDVLRAFSSCRLVHVDFDCLFGKGAQAATVVHGSQ